MQVAAAMTAPLPVMKHATFSTRATDTERWPFTVTRSTPTIGAEIGGIDLGSPIDDETCGALRRALLKFKVLFFRDQDVTPA